MSVLPRPTDSVTVDYLQLGMPYFSFAPALSGGGFGPYRSVGIIDSAEVAKALELAQLRSSHGGTSVLVRELVRQFDATLTVGLFQHSGPNLQLMFGSATLVSVSGGTPSVAGELVQLTDSELDYVDLQNGLVDEATVAMTCATVTDEAVGTGDGTSGDTQGDFTLDFKPLLVADVTSVTVGGVAFTPIAVGAQAAGNEVGVDVGATATSGELIFYVGGVAANVTGAIVATYTPSHSFVLNTDFTVDPNPGRVRMLNIGGATDALKAFQIMDADYDYTDQDHEDLTPFTQFSFSGRGRLQLLTDVGVNVLWDIPSVQARTTDTSFVFNRDEFQVSELAVTLLEDSASVGAPFGTLSLYSEPQANA